MSFPAINTQDRAPYQRAVELVHSLHDSGRLRTMKLVDLQGQVQRECDVKMTEGMALELVFDAGRKISMTRLAESLRRGGLN